MIKQSKPLENFLLRPIYLSLGVKSRAPLCENACIKPYALSSIKTGRTKISMVNAIFKVKKRTELDAHTQRYCSFVQCLLNRRITLTFFFYYAHMYFVDTDKHLYTAYHDTTDGRTA